MILLALVLATAAAAPAQHFAMTEELGSAVLSARGLAAGAPRSVRALRADVAPINSGFAALGPAGQTGEVQGPGPFGMGDGTYAVVQNDPYQMVFDMRTGFVIGRFTLTRDPETGSDSLGFTGETRDMTSPWTASSGNYAGRISYDAASDAGTISWQLNGEQKYDVYRNGRAGSRSMTITLCGNVHVFTRD